MYRSNCKLVILVLVISVLSVFAGPPHGRYLGSDLEPSYLRIDAEFTGESDPLSLDFSIVCGATRKRFEAWFKVGIWLRAQNIYAIESPLDKYKQLLSFYNKECGRTRASTPDFYNFYYDQKADIVSVKIEGPGREKKTINLYKKDS
ncbi:hypothetical protein Pmar_PMAR027591 [Perkinsus marinus ATCC 50983]|uniref:Uncharacterized protein n=1 Tax=Perkinsus marinus (strain ATCC 50983 / TXsc) TaxID=423536 RepID=C5KC63_PERM5|nr:hypothetical protein Pmar_PMAR027591 [Perkinsus marinus ATCC 50983]EER17876.1 hypothetical protein Pmar_PMAR027591 [Perkinsus marinus ATCC 50983]|eukprot:XP_002786080.1 hypothetical protein Pmar_PMAR027591 [Perkinsus marinus ATCC 50983]